MSNQPNYDTVVKNVRVVRPGRKSIDQVDLAIKNGLFAWIAHEIPGSEGDKVVDGRGLLGFPGVVDSHMHVGIYQSLDRDAVTESQAAAMGGVTSSLNYMRTGKYYLNKSGPYRKFFPEVLEMCEGKFFVDYGFHLAPMNGVHIREMEMLALELGVVSFKIFMFYGGHGLHGKSANQRDFLMIGEDEHYDLAHFEFIMRRLKEIMANNPGNSDYLSLSMHCETSEILAAYTKLVERDPNLKGLKAYSASRPEHSEGLAIFIASYLAQETECININLLHLTSRKALQAALWMEEILPQVNFRREVTIGHLLLDFDSPSSVLAKVNPPIRSREDVEFLWEMVLAGKIDWIVSDHACCSSEQKVHASNPDDVFLAKAGFGGTEHLLSGVFTEGGRRGMSYNKMAELLCWNPARRFGLVGKGDIEVGYDADLVLFDPNESFVVKAANSLSSQGYTPFEGIELKGRVKSTFLRGRTIFDEGNIVGRPTGQYLRRPYGLERFTTDLPQNQVAK